jgi:predicted metal-dependent hydrolase
MGVEGRRLVPVRRAARPRPHVISAHVTRLAGYETVLVRKNIRNIYLRVKGPDRYLDAVHPEVTAPRTARLDTLSRFVDEHRDWIDRTAAAINQTERSGEALADKWTPQRRREASARLGRRVKELLPRWTAVVGRSPSHISLRVMKTRWGSCTPATGRIRLNLELADMPDRLLEYVLVHELTHLRASGHGPLFQRYMDAYLPDWCDRRREINRHILV